MLLDAKPSLTELTSYESVIYGFTVIFTIYYYYYLTVEWIEISFNVIRVTAPFATFSLAEEELFNSRNY